VAGKREWVWENPIKNEILFNTQPWGTHCTVQYNNYFKKGNIYEGGIHKVGGSI